MPTTASSASVDISVIPVAAIERVEILTDSASAIYGSDAVAGVVNFILRTDYDGAQTSLRSGRSADGGAAEYLVSQLLGTTWTSGGVIVSYEHQKQDALYADQRSFTATAPPSTALLPQIGRDSVLLSAHTGLSDSVSLHVDALASQRDANVIQNFSLCRSS